VRRLELTPRREASEDDGSTGDRDDESQHQSRLRISTEQQTQPQYHQDSGGHLHAAAHCDQSPELANAVQGELEADAE
jgi:hypothetical protein